MIGPEEYTRTERYTIHLDELEKDWTHLELSKFRGKCIVANGCFDILHPGHISLLAQLDTIAYRSGFRPIVAMNSDVSVRRLKGDRRPIVPQESRALLINNLKWPFTVVLFDEETPQRLMDLLQPAIVVKGAEYPLSSVVKWKDSEVVTVEMVSRWSTTKIVGDTR